MKTTIPRASSRRALSLLEILVTTLIFGALMLLMTEVFQLGTSLFAGGSTRLELQNEVRRIQAAMQRALQNSNFNSVSILNNSQQVPLDPLLPHPTVSVERGGLCFNGLTDSLNQARYDALTGLPRWDCYELFWATLDVPDGKLIYARMHDPTPYSTQAVPLPGFSSAIFSLGNSELISGELKTLSHRIFHFGGSLDGPNQLVHIRLSVRTPAGRTSAQRKSLVEAVSVQYVLRPENTYPRL